MLVVLTPITGSVVHPELLRDCPLGHEHTGAPLSARHVAVDGQATPSHKELMQPLGSVGDATVPKGHPHTAAPEAEEHTWSPGQVTAWQESEAHVPLTRVCPGWHVHTGVPEVPTQADVPGHATPPHGSGA